MTINAFRRSDSAALSAEFAMVLPLLLIFLIGIIDAGRFLWTYNRAEKATQMGVRYAATTDMVAVGLASYDFYSEGIPRGNLIPESSFGGATCDSTGCTCRTDAVCPDLGAVSTTAYDNVVARMAAFMPEIAASNVKIDYDYSGLGYSGDPYGPDVNPLITVHLDGMTFNPVLLSLFGASITMPSFASTLSMEDGTGTIAN